MGFSIDDTPIFGVGRPVKDDPNFVRTPRERWIRRDQNVAGSYNHIVTDQGNLRSNESFIQMIENLGDAYEAVEEMYGMIWWLANRTPGDVSISGPEVLVEQARQNYEEGLKLAKANKNKVPKHGS